MHARSIIAAFHVHLEPIDDEHRRMSVRAIDTEVITGMSWGMGSCGPGRHYDYRRVDPTTVEEALVLAYLTTALAQ